MRERERERKRTSKQITIICIIFNTGSVKMYTIYVAAVHFLVHFFYAPIIILILLLLQLHISYITSNEKSLDRYKCFLIWLIIEIYQN